jgi:2-keto-4-pentenoate hydratase
MKHRPTPAAARLLHACWTGQRRLAALPHDLVPADRISAYQAQSALIEVFGDIRRGWKIAATSAAGQQHIGVDGPLAGQLMCHRVLASGASVPLADGGMRVAEAEFTLVLGRHLPEQAEPWNEAQVLDCLAALHPGIESPDSRFADFAHAGTAQLLAENACADWFVLGDPAPIEWRARDLAAHQVVAWRNGVRVALGQGDRVLGGPLRAAAWLANELRGLGMRWQPGEILATGTCLIPVAVAPGDHVMMDFGALGQVDARFTAATASPP